jgi:hypothetical protein
MRTFTLNSFAAWSTIARGASESTPMTEYEFTLKFALPDSASDALTDRLFAAGCDDALVGTGLPGRLALQFNRNARSAAEAVFGALGAVRKALPEARLIEAGPDLVGLSDIAALLHCSRQNMRKLMLAHRTTFPLPVHDAKTVLWHLAQVLIWFGEYQHRTVSESVLEIAGVTMQLNAALAARLVTPAVAARLAKLVPEPG